jgi:hypothetical protein
MGCVMPLVPRIKAHSTSSAYDEKMACELRMSLTKRHGRWRQSLCYRIIHIENTDQMHFSESHSLRA